MLGIGRRNTKTKVLNVLVAGLLFSNSIGWAEELGQNHSTEAELAMEIADEVRADYEMHRPEALPAEEAQPIASEATIDTPSQPLTAEPISTGPQIADSVLSGEFIKIALYGMLISFLVLLTAGITNKTVIFYDYDDLFWTLTPVVSVGIGTVISFSLIDKQQHLTDSLAATVIFGSSCLIAVFACYKSFAAAIKHNGSGLGIVIGIFKLVTSSLTAICAMGIVGRLLSGSTSLKARSFYLIFFAGLIWMLTKLVNGKEVYAQRYPHIRTA
ncbi:MAG TPA: hypothetical protein VEA37_01370 [Flavobacterium sp.]|nr:hypothetical protein [Flavobacterium sp.]